MEARISYNQNMPEVFAKKDKAILINVDSATAEIVGGIAKHEDRPLGYVARELMLNGLALYQADGRLRGDRSYIHSKEAKLIETDDIIVAVQSEGVIETKHEVKKRARK